MALFRHPHLVRGIVHTPKGAFVVLRGIVEAPDEVGEVCGWPQISEDDPPNAREAATSNGQSLEARG